MKSPLLFGAAVAAAGLVALVALPLQNAAGQQNAQNKAKPPAQQQQAPKADPKKGEEKPANAKADGKEEMPHDADAAITARYTKAAAVGEEHKWLAGLVGKWKTSSKQSIKPNSTAIEATGTSDFKLFMDGRFLIENNQAGGAQGNSQGMGIIGFNTVTGKYERIWFDSKSTAMLKSEGEYVKDLDAIKWTDQWCDPVTGQVNTTTSSLRRLDEKRMVFTQSITLPNKQEFNAVVVQYQKAE